MRCEVCGRKIRAKPCRVLIEGAKLKVCNECSKYGEAIWEEKPEYKKSNLPWMRTRTQSVIQKRRSTITGLEMTRELAENFNLKIRLAREKFAFSHEDLGKKINEKASVLRKIEAGKMVPNDVLVTKLEHALKVKLLVPVSEKTSQTKVPKIANSQVTLGDLIQLDTKNKQKEGSPERKPS